MAQDSHAKSNGGFSDLQNHELFSLSGFHRHGLLYLSKKDRVIGREQVIKGREDTPHRAGDGNEAVDLQLH
jgi:hypothetical protein